MSLEIQKQVEDNSFLVSKTNTKGIITYCNEPFLKIVGVKMGGGMSL